MKTAGALLLLVTGATATLAAQGPSAPAADATWNSLTGTGLNDASSGIHWRMPLMEADRLLPAELKKIAKPNTAITLAVQGGECTFDVSLAGLRVTAAQVAMGRDEPIDRVLESIHVEIAEGPAAQCLGEVRSQLRRQFGREIFTRPKPDWVYRRLSGKVIKGKTFRSSFQSHGTCASLRWSEGDGFPSTQPLFEVGLTPGACDPDQQPGMVHIFFEQPTS
jgi:hypothetical protein